MGDLLGCRRYLKVSGFFFMCRWATIIGRNQAQPPAMHQFPLWSHIAYTPLRLLKGVNQFNWWMDVILFLFKLQLDASEEANQWFKGGGPWEHHLEMNPLLWNFYRSWIITFDFCLGQHDEKQTNIRPTQIWIPLQKSHFWTVQGCNQRLFSFVFICGRKWAPRLLPPLSQCWLIRFWGGFFGPIK